MSDTKNKKTLECTVYSTVWCPHCRALSAAMEGVEQEYPQITFRHINTEQEPTKAEQADIRTVPTVLLSDNGKEIDRFSGFKNRQAVKAFLDAHV